MDMHLRLGVLQMDCCVGDIRGNLAHAGELVETAHQRGQRESPPVMLLPPGGTYAPIWVRNVGPVSQSYRIYAVDIVGELNRSVPIRPIRSHGEFMEWMSDLLDGLHLESTHLVGNSNGGFFALETALYFPSESGESCLSARRPPLSRCGSGGGTS